MSDEQVLEWITVFVGNQNALFKMKVEGGYLYKTTSVVVDKYNMIINKTESMVFVPDVDLARYRSHLRDAYNQGFKDGQSNPSIKTTTDME